MKYLYFDLETTGIDIYNDCIIEYGAILCEDDNIIRQEDVFVNIGFPIPEQIVALTHITDDILNKEGVSEFELFCLIDEMIDDDTILVAYNIQFDINFLISLFQKYKKNDFVFENKILDVLAIYKDREPYPHRLKDAIMKYNIEAKNTHRAIDDVYATVLLKQEMAKQKDNIDKYINVVGYKKEYGVMGRKLNQVLYIVQKGGQREIEKL